MIRFKNLTKRFENGKGISDFSFEVEEGEVFGLIGGEASGKSTALRMLMGFEIPTRGRCAINGKDCDKAAVSLHRIIGYLPDKIALPSALTGRQFLHSCAQIRGIKNLERLFELAQKLELDVDQRIAGMTAADVQKTGIVAAFMHNPQILLLDEPFANLDSRARGNLVELILEEKEKGRIILLTADSAEIADLTCDRVGLLDHGNLIYLSDIENMRDNMYRKYLLQFGSAHTAMKFAKEDFEIESMKDRSLTVSIQGELLPLVRVLAKYHITSIEPVPLSLQETFTHIYGGGLNG